VIQSLSVKPVRTWPPLHPFLLALMPVLTLYTLYFGTYPTSDFLITLSAFQVLAAAVFFPAWLLLRRARAAAVFAFAFLAMFFAYDPALSLLEREGEPVGATAQAAALVVMLVALGWLGWRLKRSTGQFENLNRILTVAAAGMLLVPMGQLAVLYAGPAEVGEPVLRAAPPLPEPTRRPEPLPNIYLIVLDRYADAETLAGRFGHDNSDFYDSLRRRGFYVANHSRSNYLKTAQSLASALNLEYLDSVAEDAGRDSPEWHPLYERIADHAVARFLRAQGYRYVHAGSWWWPTRLNPRADLNVNAYLQPPELSRTARRSPFYPIAARFRVPLFDIRLQQWLRVPYQLREIRRLAAAPGPTFFFFHVLVPHDPYVFAADGSFMTEERDFAQGEEVSYRNQLQWINGEIGALVDDLLKVSATPPVIVLMSDEGTFPRRYRDDERGFDWRAATLEELREKTGILHTFYLPCGDAELYPEVSPVNSFRVVFNACFGTGLPLLPDRVFAHPSDDQPYGFFDVTGKVRGPLKAERRRQE
jgi:hypothetical protein